MRSAFCSPLGVVSARQFRLLIGNFCSINVLERILMRVLDNVGLARMCCMHQRWESLELAKATVLNLKSP